MKLITLAFLIFIILSGPSMFAQKLVDSVITASKLKTEYKVVDHASDKIDKGIDNILSGNIFKRKTKTKSDKNIDPPQGAPVAEGTVVKFIIENIEYAFLSNLQEVLETDSLTLSVENEYSNKKGVLTVRHKGSDNKLLKDLLKANGQLDVINISPGEINLKMK